MKRQIKTIMRKMEESKTSSRDSSPRDRIKTVIEGLMGNIRVKEKNP